MILFIRFFLSVSLAFFTTYGALPLLGQETTAANAAAPSQDSSLVSNPDFALATKDPTWPDDWGKGKGVSWETESGKHFLRLVAQEPGKMLMAYREIAIPAGVKNIQISIRYRTSGVVAGDQNFMDARAIFHFLDANRKPVAPDPRTLDFSTGAAVWTDATEQCAVPAGAEKLVLMPSLFKVASGTLDLAEVTVTPVTQ